LQSDPYNYLGHMHAGQTVGFACRGSSSDPAKSFQPISLRDEAIVLSYIAIDSDGGIHWGAFSVQGGAHSVSKEGRIQCPRRGAFSVQGGAHSVSKEGRKPPRVSDLEP
jgi:hypothetical protein